MRDHEESDADRLAITQAVMLEMRDDFDAILDGVTRNMPACWDAAYGWTQNLTVVEYVRHLEKTVDAMAQGGEAQSRHHPNCDGACHVDPCPLCAKKQPHDG